MGLIGGDDTTGMSLKPSQFDLISRLLDASQMRHRAVAQNVANVNTPGYKAITVNFEEELSQQLDGDLSKVVPKFEKVQGATVRADGNNVDIDREMGESQKNELLNNVFNLVLVNKINAIRSAISGRS